MIEVRRIESLCSLRGAIRVVMVLNHRIPAYVPALIILLHRFSDEVHPIVWPELVWRWEIPSRARRPFKLRWLGVVEGFSMRPRRPVRRGRLRAVVMLDHLQRTAVTNSFIVVSLLRRRARRRAVCQCQRTYDTVTMSGRWWWRRRRGLVLILHRYLWRYWRQRGNVVCGHRLTQRAVSICSILGW